MPGISAVHAGGSCFSNSMSCAESDSSAGASASAVVPRLVDANCGGELADCDSVIEDTSFTPLVLR